MQNYLVLLLMLCKFLNLCLFWYLINNAIWPSVTIMCNCHGLGWVRLSVVGVLSILRTCFSLCMCLCIFQMAACLQYIPHHRKVNRQVWRNTEKHQARWLSIVVYVCRCICVCLCACVYAVKVNLIFINLFLRALFCLCVTQYVYSFLLQCIQCSTLMNYM